MVATSIGLAVKGVPVVGVIYNPFLDLLVGPPTLEIRLVTSKQYSAAKGRGAFQNQQTKLPLTGKPKPFTSLRQASSALHLGSFGSR
jgi:myo-inositol-1(or 4)-monophosphatase